MPNFKNSRPNAVPLGFRNPVDIPKIKVADKKLYASARVNKGMITMIDPADIPNEALQLARNARCRFDKTTRRPGTKLFTPVKPNTNPVIGVFFHKKNNGQTFFLRFTRNSIHYVSGGAWTALTAGVGGSLVGSDTDRFRGVTAFDRFVFANNGVDVLQEFDDVANTYKALGNAPKYKYITAFYNRIVGANLQGATPDATNVGWSADGVIDEWDPGVNETAGSSPIVDSPSDLGDFISGIFGFTSNMILLREQSVWIATKQAIPTQPFYFYTAVPGLGGDCPDSAAITLNGLTWVDRRSGSVWSYQPGGQPPERIGLSIEKDLMRALDDPALVFGSYAPIENEYTVCIPLVGFDGVREWVYNFRTGAWTVGEREAVTSIDDTDLAAALVSIDDLGLIPIDQLSGTIDSLSPGSDIIPVRIFGRNDGELVQEDENIYTDPPVAGSANAEGKFMTELVSKTFTQLKDDAYFAEIRIEYVPISAAPMTLSYSRDGGVTFNTLVKTITPTADQLGKPQIFRWVKSIKARRFAFKLSYDDGQFEVNGYEVHVYPGGESNS